MTYTLHTYFTYEFAINEAKKSASLRNQAQVTNIMKDLDRYIDGRISNFNNIAQVRQIHEEVIKSNKQFSDVDVQSIQTRTPNSTGKKIPFLQEAQSSKLSSDLREIVNLYKNEYNYDVVSELFVTNMYGANIALGAGTSDYLQNDEAWWQVTKNKQVYIGNIEYQEDYNDYALTLAYPILDESDNFIGSMRILITMEDLLHDFVNDVDILRESKKNVVLLNDDGQIIFENGNYYPGNSKQYFSHLTDHSNTIEITDGDHSFLVSYVRSIGFKDFKGFDWIAIIEQDQSVILDDFNDLRTSILISSVIGVVTAVALSLILSYFVTNPLKKMSKLTTKLGQGDFNTTMQKSKITEINAIVDSFNKMEISLKKLLETEKKLAEANIKIKNERLTAIGELAASMAHDMKNPLGTIRSGIDIIKRSLGPSKDMQDVMKRTERAISRISHQIEDVLNYVRVTPLDVKPMMIKSIIQSAIQSVNVPKNITIEFDGSDAQINCDERKMEIVFINLILNSVQAIGNDGGTITIRIRIRDNNVMVEIQDSGQGVPESIAADMFKPLVTTKQQGTGLGLASCKNIIEQHGGTITFKNDPTIFSVFIPRDLRTNETI